MYKATLYFSHKDQDTRNAACARAIELGIEFGLKSATIFDTVGIWKGNREPGFAYSVLYPFRVTLEAGVKTVAAHLALEYDQESILVEVEQVMSAQLVSRDGETREVVS